MHIIGVWFVWLQLALWDVEQHLTQSRIYAESTTIAINVVLMQTHGPQILEFYMHACLHIAFKP